MIPRLSLAILVLGAALVVALPSTASVAARSDLHAPLWNARLTRDLAEYPQITRAALKQARELALYRKVFFVQGAIGGRIAPAAVCEPLRSNPEGYNTAIRKVLFKSKVDYDLAKSEHVAVAQLVADYRDGILFGCG